MADETAKPEPLDKVQDNATPEDFIMKNKVYELIRYGNPILDNFPRYERYGKQRGNPLFLWERAVTIEDVLCLTGGPLSTTPATVALRR